MADLFEQAAERKLRFTTSKGLATSEDLFDLPLEIAMGVRKKETSLEAMWIALDSEIKEYGKAESPLKKKPAVNRDLALRFAIVNRVIEIRMAKNAAAKNRVLKKEKAEQLDRLIFDAENEELRKTPLADLKKMREEL